MGHSGDVRCARGDRRKDHGHTVTRGGSTPRTATSATIKPVEEPRPIERQQTTQIKTATQLLRSGIDWPRHQHQQADRKRRAQEVIHIGRTRRRHHAVQSIPEAGCDWGTYISKS